MFDKKNPFSIFQAMEVRIPVLSNVFLAMYVQNPKWKKVGKPVSNTVTTAHSHWKVSR